MYCKDCKYRKEVERYGGKTFKCSNDSKIYEDGWPSEDESKNDTLVYSYEEGGEFYVGEMFGCVHFTSNKGESHE